MPDKTVIITHRRRERDYWEGYIERTESEAGDWIAYYRSIGHVVKVFPDMIAYRADCQRRLDRWEQNRARRQKETT